MTEQLPPGPPSLPGGYYLYTPPPAQKKFQWNFLSIIGLITVLLFAYGLIIAAIHVVTPPSVQSQPAAGPIAYPAAYEESFIQDCETHGGTTNGCTCAMNWIERNMTLDQYIAESNASVQAGVLTPDLHEADVVCAHA